MFYSEAGLMRIAKRVNNTKRTYLLVNPLQAKHIPVSPSKALDMMGCLGDKLVKKYPDTRLVIGFAETATAAGAAVASCFPHDCVYLPTTREDIPGVTDWVLFSEEHSHATEQKLCGEHLAGWIADTPSVIFVDDEISTGKTLLNMIRKLQEQYPQLKAKKLAAASLLNRVSPEHERLLLEAGVNCEYLVKATGSGPEQAVEGIQASEAPPVKAVDHAYAHRQLDCPPLPNPREGIWIQSYLQDCEQMAQEILSQAGLALKGIDNIVVLGTEECMYPALILGKRLEEKGYQVKCHATTRSPIGICRAPGYPITNGNKLRSFYAEDRSTYLYNLEPCGALVVVSDTPKPDLAAFNDLVTAWTPHEYGKAFYVQGGRNVWYL